MPNLEEHNNDCTSKGNPFEICNKTNKYMDYPSKITPGCKHRSERHDPETCEYLFNMGRTYTEKLYYYNACQAHRDLDRSNSNNCGCLGLFQEYTRDIEDISSLDPILYNNLTPNYDFLLYDEFPSFRNNTDSGLYCSLRDPKRNKKGDRQKYV